MVDGGGSTTVPGGDFQHCVERVLDWEGAATNDADDPGGQTIYGLARRYHPTLDPWPPTLKQAIQVYRSQYWVPVRGDELPAPLALVVFDGAVVPGLGWAARALQEVLQVEPDGVIGPDTIAAARRSGWRTVHAFTAARLAEFERAVRARPVNTKYAAGWRSRALLAYRGAVKLERDL